MNTFSSLLISSIFLVPAFGKVKLLLSQSAAGHPSHYPTRRLRIEAYIAETAKAAFYFLFAAVFGWHLLPLSESIRESPFSDLLVPVAALSGVLGAILSYRIQPRAPHQPARTPSKWIEYTESTDDPEALAETLGLNGIRAELVALGFLPAHLLTAQTTMLRKAISVSGEVFSCRTAFATPGVFKGCHTLSFRTRLDNGVIVETTLLQPIKKANRLLDAVRERWTRQRWPRRLRSRAGYWIELLGSSPSIAWKRHCDRVEQLARKYGSTIPSHTDTSFYIAIASDSFGIAALGTLADLMALIIPLPTLVLLVQFAAGKIDFGRVQWAVIGLTLLLAEVVALRLSRRLSRSQLHRIGRLFGYAANP
jgi:hypothetical protein